jgi:hypothetical protein
MTARHCPGRNFFGRAIDAAATRRKRLLRAAFAMIS